MKLSAPPPPPPEPPEPGPPPDPNDEALCAGPAPVVIGSPEPVPIPIGGPATAAAPKPAEWPAWFGGVDAALVVLAVALGFLAASFAARNSDLWLHIAAGKMLTTGEYHLGSDPFSYSAADRPWVNHSWLYDLGVYVLYGGNGVLLVFVKALAAAGAVALLIGIRRPGQSLWPWAVAAGVAVIAAAPRMLLHPNLGSILLLAASLFILFRLPSRPGSWRIPLAIAGVFWLWANIDTWFILGPLTVGLLLLGEVIQQKILMRPDEPNADEPLGRLPDLTTLARALGIGVVACMLNPHHIRVWELPFELIGADAAALDPQLKQALLTSPLDKIYYEREAAGYNLNGLAYAILFVGGGLLLGFGAGRLRVSHLLLWVGFAVLSLATVFAIPFFAVVAVPLVAAQLNALSPRVALGSRTDRRTRMLLAGSGFGRVLSLLALLIGCAAAWPGWLHAPPPWASVGNPATVRRVDWKVEPDLALLRAASQFREWREAGLLPADAHGMSTSVELANYCAYFAPGEKVFINSRYNHHRPELEEFTRLRGAMGMTLREEPPSIAEVGQILDRHHAAYLALYDASTNRFAGTQAARGLWFATDQWSAWYLDGRTVICGWRPNTPGTPPAFDRLRIDPSSLAFGPNIPRLPAGGVQPIPAPRELFDEFARPVRPSPPEADEALAWLDFKDVVRTGLVVRQGIGLQLFVATPAPQGHSTHGFTTRVMAETGQVPQPLQPRDGGMLAVPILAVRAARRAIATNPDHPDGYFALGRALADRELSINEGERSLAVVTAYRQCLSRMPPPDQFRRNVYVASPSDVARTLAMLYLNPGQNGQPRGMRLNSTPFPELVHAVPGPQGQPVQAPLLPLDLAREAMVLANKYAEKESLGWNPDSRERRLKELDDMQKQIGEMLRVADDQYRRDEARATKVQHRFVLARRTNLIGRAIGMMKDLKEGELAREFGPDAPSAALQLVALEMGVGRLEDAAADIATLREEFDKMAADPRPDPVLPLARGALRWLEFQKLLLSGEYARAGEELEALQGRGIGTEALVAEMDKQKVDPRAYKDFDMLWPRIGALGVAWPVIPMLGSDSPMGVLANYAGAVAQLQHFERMAVAKQAIAGKVQQDADFFFRRGYLSLLEGDSVAAKIRFQQALSRPIPPGWGLEPYRPAIAQEYIRLIDVAEQKANGPGK